MRLEPACETDNVSTSRTVLVSGKYAQIITAWINKFLEALWLLTAFLVPLVFLGRDYAASEAVISYVEVPKIALLRTLVALMAILWLVEWAIQGRIPLVSLWTKPSPRFCPSLWWASLVGWLRKQPSRWVILAVWFFLGTTLLSTVLSGSFKVSLWGEVPGQDGYAAYTIVAYVVLFGVITTHLRTKAQLWRLIGAIAFMGVLVSGYGVFQHFGRDFLGLTEPTGGGTSRVTSFMGNTIFAAAVMLMTILLSLAASILSMRNSLDTTEEVGWRVKPWMQAVAISSLWAMAIMIQLLGIAFTFSRGPWVGMVVALVMLLGFGALFLGWRIFGRMTVVLGLAAVFGLAVLYGVGSISIPGLSPWLGLGFGLAGFVWIAAVLAPWRRLFEVSIGLGAVATLIASVLLGVVWIKGDIGNFFDGSDTSIMATPSTPGQVAGRISTIKSDVSSGLLGGRITHWRVSSKLIQDHPWPEFDNLGLSWARPAVGYGPDLFRYTYLLESPAEGVGLLPLEPDHAHNYFIHQTVEQGFLGLSSALGIFAAVVFSGLYHLCRQRQRLSTAHRVMLIALLAIVVGRFFEMMFGVARISDLTGLWILLAMFAALPTVMQLKDSPVAVAGSTQPSRSQRKPPFLANTNRDAWYYQLQRLLVYAIVGIIIGAIVTLTWVKSTNYVRASVSAGSAIQHFQQGDFQASLNSFDRAIELAPDVSVYHNNRSNVYLAYQLNQNIPPESGCDSQNDLPYNGCLAVRGLESDLEGVARNPLYYRSWLALANSAFNLKWDDAIRFYERSLALVPGSWLIRNELAEAYIEANRVDEAIPVLAESLRITKDSFNSAPALALQITAYQLLGESQALQESIDRLLNLESARATTPDEKLAERYERLVEIYSSNVQKEFEVVDDNFNVNPGDHEGLAQHLSDNSSLITRFQQPELAPQFLLYMGLKSLDSRRFNVAASYFNDSARLYLGLNLSEGAAIAFSQEALAYRILKQQLGRDISEEGLQALEQSLRLYDELSPTELTAQLNFQLSVTYLDFDMATATRSFEKTAEFYSDSRQFGLTTESLVKVGLIYQALSHRTEVPALGSSMRPFETTVLQLAQSAYDLRRTTTEFVFIPFVAVSDKLDSDPIQLYGEVLKLVPGNKEILYLLATALLDADRAAEALTVIAESLEITKDTAESDRMLILQGSAYINGGEFTNAIQAMERFIEKRGFKAWDLGAIGIMGLAYDGQGRTEMAASKFMEQGKVYVGRTEFGSAEEWFVRSAEAYQELGRPDLAAEVLSSAKKLAERYERLVEIYSSNVQKEFEVVDDNFNVNPGDHEGLAQHLSDNSSLITRFQQPELAPQFLLYMGLKSLDSRRFNVAASYFNDSARLYLGLNLSEGAAIAFSQEALAYRILKQQLGRDISEEGLQALEQSLRLYDELSPTELTAQLNFQLSVTYLDFDMATATRSFEKTAEFYSDSRQFGLTTESLVKVGLIYQALSHRTEVPALGSSMRPFETTVLQLAQSAYDLRRTTTEFVFIPFVAVSDKLDSDPIQLYGEVLKLVPGNKEILYLLATALLDADRAAEALTVIAESLEITKDTAESDRMLILQGSAYINGGEFTNAIQAMERFIEKRGFKAWDLGAIGIMGLAYDGQGRTEMAASKFMEQGKVYVGRTEFGSAEEWFVRSAEAYQELGRPDLAAEALSSAAKIRS